MKKHEENVMEKNDGFITLISIKKLKQEDQQNLIAILIDMTENVIKNIPGFISASFYKSLDGTRVVNQAKWRSKHDWEAAMFENETVKEYLKKIKQFETEFEDVGLYDLAYYESVVNRIKSVTENASKFTYSFEEHIEIPARPSAVYEALYLMREWPNYLPHVKEIDVLYDDNQYQEFFMHVLSPDNEILKVRSMRNCKGDSIIFYQPEPPKFLKRHAGRWTFKELEHDVCQLNAYHTWDINDEIANTQFGESDNISTSAQIEELLRKHARMTIGTWQKIFREKKFYSKK